MPIQYRQHGIAALIRGRPYSAKVELTHQEGTQFSTSSAFIARDSLGRERHETHPEPGITLVQILDPVAEKQYTIDITARMFEERPYARDQQVWGTPRPLPDKADKQVIEGIECYRVEMTVGLDESDVKEFVIAWLSPEIGLMAEEFTDSKGCKGSWRLQNIVFGEPDSDLFKLPEGFSAKRIT